MDPVVFYKSLADATRLQILMLLMAQGELCVCELGDSLRQPQPKISRHLALLRQSSLIEDRRQGVWVYYRLHPDLPRWCRTVLEETLAEGQHAGGTGTRGRPFRKGACL